MRTFLVQGAHAVLVLHTKGRLPKSALKKWIDKKLSAGMPCSKLGIALAAKLLRIAFAVLKHKEKFDIKRASVARCNLDQYVMRKLKALPHSLQVRLVTNHKHGAL